MTIAELISSLCSTIGEMSTIINELSNRLMISGTLTRGEAEQIDEIRKRLQTMGIKDSESVL